jgi:hypothetical protein
MRTPYLKGNIMDNTEITLEVTSNAKRIALRVAKVAVIATVAVLGTKYLVQKLNSAETDVATTE